MTANRLFADKTQNAIMEEPTRLYSRDLCQKLLYPAPQLLSWFRPAGSRVAFLIDMKDVPSASDHQD